MRNYEIKADDIDIVRCKDCINNPGRKGNKKHMCPLNDMYNYDEMATLDVEEYYYSETVDDNWVDPNDDWFCANGERE